jgi:hypothetical protein
MKELEAGKLYQVKAEKGWVIAEYMKPQPAHSYGYNDIYLDSTIHVGPKKIKHVPDTHLWKKVRALPASYPSTFSVLDKGMEIRPVTAEAIAEIDRLKQEIIRLEAARVATVKELREFCE